MSRTRHPLSIEQEPFLIVRSFACDYSSGFTIEPHHHAWRQLLYASSGAMSVQADRQSWLIPPGKAVFFPAACGHSVRMWGTVSMRSLVFPQRPLGPVLPIEQCCVLSVNPLLRELILRVIAIGALDSRVPSHHHMLDVLLDEMAATRVEPLALHLPADLSALAIARYIESHPSCDQTLDQLARRHGASRRTLERRFRHETGMSFGLWRQKLRLLHSVRLLSEGSSVTDAALECGYTSVSAFIAAFKKTFGSTPGSQEAS